MLCGMRDALPEAAIGFFTLRLGLIAALGNGRSPKLRREGADAVAAHSRRTFTARASVRFVLAHRSSRGRRSIAPGRRHFMSEQAMACRAAAPCDDPPALRDALHRGHSTTGLHRHRNVWAPRIEADPMPRRIEPESIPFSDSCRITPSLSAPHAELLEWHFICHGCARAKS